MAECNFPMAEASTRSDDGSCLDLIASEKGKVTTERKDYRFRVCLKEGKSQLRPLNIG